MRPLWKGAVSFGLVYVPVKLYTATESKSIKFHYLHDRCKHPVKYIRYCSYCETEVSMDEIVRGYEYEKGRYVVLTDEDLENLPEAVPRNIEILDFIDLKEIDPVYYHKAYFLIPSEGGHKVYELLKQAMEETGKVAVARVLIRSKQSLAAVRVAKNTLMMSTMFYPDEVRDTAGIPEVNYNVKLSAQELKMAKDLIRNLTSRFDPSKYTDKYREKLLEIVQSKISGREVEQPAAKTEEGKVVDLMEALKASIELARQEREKAASS